MRTHFVALVAALVVTRAATLTFAGEQATDLLPSGQVEALVTTAATSAEHERLARHYRALASKYEADAANHKALAARYRKQPTASETKRPGSPDTAAHCERFAKLSADAAKKAKALGSAHERMAVDR
jgi:hypothetical protein